MMKKYRLYFSALILAAALAFTAYSQDYEMADAAGGDANDALPEGMYPLETGSISVSAEGSGQPWGAEDPQTRVSETDDGADSEFKNGDAITVSLSGNRATYTYDGSAWTSNAPLHWQSTQPATVTAWYPATETISLADQSGELAYVLKSTWTGSYQSGVNLTFTHQLAKVRVELTGVKSGDVTGMEIYNYTSCTNTQGNVSGASAGWITMKSVTDNSKKFWEANVVPGYAITHFCINKTTDVTLNGNGITPVAGNRHTITITVEPSSETLKTTFYNGFFKKRSTSSPKGTFKGTYYFLYATSTTIQKLFTEILKTSMSYGYSLNITVNSTNFFVYIDSHADDHPEFVL